MMKVKNVSPYGVLFVPALGRDVDAGEIVEIEDNELAESLLVQTTHFAPVGKETRETVKELKEEGVIE